MIDNSRFLELMTITMNPRQTAELIFLVSPSLWCGVENTAGNGHGVQTVRQTTVPMSDAEANALPAARVRAAPLYVPAGKPVRKNLHHE